MSSKSKILFYYPTKSIGGAQLLFAKLAAQLSRDKHKVIVVERNSCFISDFLGQQAVNFERVNLGDDEKYKLKGDELCLLSVSFLMRLDDAFEWQQSNRILFWELHPYAIVESLSVSGFLKNDRLSFFHPLFKSIDSKGINLVNAFIKKALYHGGLLFMCGKNLEYNRRFFKIDNTSEFLPIPVDLNREPFEYVYKSKLLITWIGRLDYDKEHLFHALMQDIDLDKVDLSVIGDGNAMANIIDKYKGLGSSVRFLGYVNQEGLDDHLRRTDVGIGIGTSALEFAKRGIASLIMPGVNELSNFDEKKYNWLYNSKNGNLSALFSKSEQCITLDEAISNYMAAPKSHRQNSFDYAQANHSWISVYSKLTKFINDNSFTYAELRATRVLDINRSVLNRSKQLYKRKIK